MILAKPIKEKHTFEIGGIKNRAHIIIAALFFKSLMIEGYLVKVDNRVVEEILKTNKLINGKKNDK